MTRERLSGGDARHPRTRPEVTLQPPPRPGAALPSSQGARSSAPRPALIRSVAAIGLVCLLAGASVGVFVLLPKWVARTPGPSAAAARPSVPPAASPAPRASLPPVVEAADPSANPPPVPPAPSSEPAVAERAAAPAAPAGEPEAAEWSRAMSEGLAALDRGQFGPARAALARAEAARPGTQAVADALQRAEEGEKTEALAGHHARGASAEAREDWKTAVAEYDAALKIAPQVAFAQQGRARSLPRVELDERLSAYLKQPERLSAEAVAREADDALERARAASPAGPRLQQQAAALERLLVDARTPVDVRLVSDGLTDVAVLRVGTMGRFREKTLALRPGSYVVVGRRQGYRDTRNTLVVAPGRTPAPVDVRCSETL